MMGRNTTTVIVIALCMAAMGCCQGQVLQTRFYNDTVRKGQYVELHLLQVPASYVSINCGYAKPDGALERLTFKLPGQGLQVTSTLKGEYYGRVSVRGNITIISNISFADESNKFYCAVYRISGEGIIVTNGPVHILKSVEEPPSVTGVKLNSSYTREEGESLTLSCKFIGRPHINASWTGNIRRIGVLRKTERTVGELVELTLDLVINRLQYFHNGYGGICRTQNHFGYAEQATKLNITFTPKNTSLHILPQNLTEGVNIFLNCTAHANPAVQNYHFYKDSTLIHRSVSGFYTFLSRNCTEESGKYRCEPVNALGNGTIAQKDVNIYGSPKATLPTNLIRLNESDLLLLSCTTRGCPVPNITWNKNGERIPMQSQHIFQINSLAPSDTGVYQCVASNSKEHDRAVVAVTVQYTPRNTSLTFSPNEITEGMTVSITCRSQAEPPVNRYQLFRNGNLISSSSNVTFSFVSTNCTEEIGVYRCLPRNSLGEGAAKQVNISVYGPPKITVVQNTFTVNETRNVTLTCFVSGCPVPLISWYKEGSPVLLARGPNLHLVNLRPSDAGSYRCVASNARENTSEIVQLHVRYPPRNASLTIADGELREGMIITLICNANAYPAVDTYSFYRHGRVVNVTKSNRYSFVSKECEVEQGNYTCVPRNAMGTESTAKASISIYGSPKPQIPPTLRSVVVNEGAVLQLSCVAKGCPTPEISWYKEGRQAALRKGPVFPLSVQSPSDAGRYSCFAYNSRENRSTYATLTVNYHPRNLSIQTNTVNNLLEEGRELQFNCQALAHPPARYRIFRNGVTLDANSSGIVIISNTNCTLHSGLYTCNAFNIRGETSNQSQQVTIEGIPSLTLVPLSKTANETNKVSFACAATGCPSPTIHWYSKGKLIHTGGTLHFDKVNRLNDSEYECSAANKKGSSNTTVTLSVQYQAMGTKLAVKSSTVLAGSSLELRCSALGKPKPVYTFYRKTALTSFAEISSANSKITGILVTTVDYDESYMATYDCLPENLLGFAKRTQQNITIQVPPTGHYILPRETLIELEESRDLVLECKVTFANPKVSIAWTKDGNTNVLSSDAKLSFKGIKRTDSGTYNCTASNKVGNPSNKQISLNVTYKPSISMAIKTAFNICIDEQVDLNCKGVGNPTPHATITQGSNVLTTGYGQASFSFTVTNERYGDYVCQLRNKVGVTTKKITVNRQALPGSPKATIKVKDNSLVVSWKTPKCSGQKGVASYIVYFRAKNGKEQNVAIKCNTLVCEHTLSGLEEKTNYEVSVVAVDATGKLGRKIFVQGIETQAAVSPPNKNKLSKSTVAFIIIGGVVAFLVVVALFILIRKRIVTTDDATVTKSDETDKGPKEQVLKFDNAAYDGQGPKSKSDEIDEEDPNRNGDVSDLYAKVRKDADGNILVPSDEADEAGEQPTSEETPNEEVEAEVEIGQVNAGQITEEENNEVENKTEDVPVKKPVSHEC